MSSCTKLETLSKDPEQLPPKTILTWSHTRDTSRRVNPTKGLIEGTITRLGSSELTGVDRCWSHSDHSRIIKIIGIEGEVLKIKQYYRIKEHHRTIPTLCSATAPGLCNIQNKFDGTLVDKRPAVILSDRQTTLFHPNNRRAIASYDVTAQNPTHSS
ncbi:hypothetical protein J6590_013077 [Homalodisca vitripennis]|nr:hypothetical protein J6590_102220 [Homalodisca vitripennis]KAG8317942.1 hypothetical protein J6590_013077 [Homalodisca vitripennis]